MPALGYWVKESVGLVVHFPLKDVANKYPVTVTVTVSRTCLAIVTVTVPFIYLIWSRSRSQSWYIYLKIIWRSRSRSWYLPWKHVYSETPRGWCKAYKNSTCAYQSYLTQLQLTLDLLSLFEFEFITYMFTSTARALTKLIWRNFGWLVTCFHYSNLN